jgi:hypothetical protein
MVVDNETGAESLMQLERKYTEAAETFMREITPAEEDRHLFTSAPWRGGYRWYRSPNVICLEQFGRPASSPTSKAA